MEDTVLQLSTVNNQERIPRHIVRGIVITNLVGSEQITLPPLLTVKDIPLNTEDVSSNQDIVPYLREQGVQLYPVKGPIELLLGANAALAMEPLQAVRSRNGGPFAILTRFGWILGGAKLSSRVPKLNKIQVQQNWKSVPGTLASAETGHLVEDRLNQAKSDASCKKTQRTNANDRQGSVQMSDQSPMLSIMEANLKEIGPKIMLSSSRGSTRRATGEPTPTLRQPTGEPPLASEQAIGGTTTATEQPTEEPEPTSEQPAGELQHCIVKNRTRFYGGSVKARHFLNKLFSSTMLKAPQEGYPRAARKIFK